MQDTEYIVIYLSYVGYLLRAHVWNDIPSSNTYGEYWVGCRSDQ